jgi:enoyl-CoA hydratase/carnithine racemase
VIEQSNKGGIAVLKLAHGKANTMDIELCQAVIEAFRQLRSSAAQAVVLTGQGSIFSAGVDLVRTSDGGPPYVRKFLPVLNAMFDAVFHFPRPVVAAINGHAIAGGCVLACCADRRLMAQGNGRIGVTELLVGLPFPALAFEIMRLVTAPRYFPQSIYDGATVISDSGAERGWIHEVVAPAELIERAVASAQILAALPATTFAMTKSQMHAAVIERIELSGDEIDADVTEIWTAADATARIRDYVTRTLKKR